MTMNTTAKQLLDKAMHRALVNRCVKVFIKQPSFQVERL